MSSVRRSFDLPVELAARVEEHAAVTGKSGDEIVRHAVVQALPPAPGTAAREAYDAMFPVKHPLSELFRSTGLSEEEGDDHGQGESVGE